MQYQTNHKKKSVSSTTRYVNCQYKFFKDIPDDIPDDTLKLYLDGNQIEQVKRNKLSHLTDLESLSLSSNIISFIEDNAFDDLAKLTSLHLRENRIFQIKRSFFKNLSLLHELRLSKISTPQPLHIEDFAFENLSRLNELTLASNNIIRVSNNTFTGLTTLQLLDLSNNNIKLFSSNSFHSLPRSATIRLTTKPLCCCQSQSAFTALETQLTCTDQSNAEGNINTMQCFIDGDVCSSYRESTSDLWPPLPVSSSSSTFPGSTKIILSSSVNASSTGVLQLPSSSEVIQLSSSSEIIQIPSFSDFSTLLTSSIAISEIIQTPSTSSEVQPSSLTPREYKSSTESSNLITTTLNVFSSSTDVIGQTSMVIKTSDSLTIKYIDSTREVSSMISSSIMETESTSSSMTQVVPNNATSLTSSTEVKTTFIVTPSNRSKDQTIHKTSTMSLILILQTSSSTAVVSCSQTGCRNGCTFSQTACKCVNNTSLKDCQLSTPSDTQTGSDDTSMETWKIALLTGCGIFLVVFIIVFIYFKKRQHRERGFTIASSTGQIGQRRQLEMKSSPPGRDNGAFIIEESKNGNQPLSSRRTAEIY